MFGVYRFLLALLVVIEHAGLIKNFHVGAVGVIGFYILAGYVMNHSFRRNFSLQLSNVPQFYLDRFLRIYPIYWFILFIVVIFFIAIEARSIHLNSWNLLTNLSLVPLNFFMFLDAKDIFIVRDSTFPVPPAPSVGLEIQFYLLIPFLLYFRPLLYIAFVVSFMVFTFAMYGEIDPYNYGYILLPGTLFIFLTGSVLYNYLHGIDGRICKRYLVSIPVLLFAVLGILVYKRKIDLGHNLEIITGFYIGLAATFFLSQVEFKTPEMKKVGYRIDKFMGGVSYPIFLSHWLSIWIAEYVARVNLYNPSERGRVVLIILMTIAISAISYVYVDSGIQRLRKKIQPRTGA